MVIVGSMFLAMGFTDIFILVLVLVKIGFELFTNFDGFIDKAEAESKKKIAEEQMQNQLKR